jgi:hypothetical protein
MTTLTLLVKTSHGGQLKQIDNFLKSEFEELDVEIKVLGNTGNRWVQVELSGEDEVIATSYINKKIGTCPISLENAKNQGTITGYISKVDSNKQELKVDIGVFEPRIIQATIPVVKLQAQLLHNKIVDLKRIAESFSLVEGLPIGVQLIQSNTGEEIVEAELSAGEAERLGRWQMSLLDRLVILGASKESVTLVLERTRLNRDVINVEELGLFVQALTCKLGTQAAGLIPVIGRYMRYSVFAVFNAKRSAEFLTLEESKQR